MRFPPTRSKASRDESGTVGRPDDLTGGLAGLIASIKPLALCDSCIALDVHVSHAEAHEAAVSAAMGEAFERRVQSCHRCGRTVEATCAR
jgi:hypothetical protein